MEKITDKIKSFEDACKHLRLNPNDLPVVDMLPEKDRKSIIAFYKLTIIIRALNEGWEIGQIGMNVSITTGFTLKKEKTSVPPVFVTAIRTTRLRTRAPALGFALRIEN